MITPEIKVLPDPSTVAEEASRRAVRIAHESIERQDSFSIVLSGGSTPKALYEKLASEPFRSQVDWAKVKIFFGDERCVPPDHADSNYRMARLALLSEVPIPGDNIYRIRGEIDPQQAAIEYGQLLKEQFGDGGAELLLLGKGEEGHHEWVVPRTKPLKQSQHRCAANYGEKLSTWRGTMTAPFINRAGHVMVLVCGANKASRVQEVLEGPSEPQRLPIQMIAPHAGSMTWLL